MKFDYIPKNRFRDLTISMACEIGPLFIDGNFCTDSGNTIYGEASFASAEIFSAVENGIVILPNEQNISPLKSNSFQNSKESAGIGDRTWSQEFLTNLGPDQISPGELCGNGNRFQAYQFGNLTIVEFDIEAHATYLFISKFFNQLRSWTRQEILENQPSGFIKRIFHSSENLDLWKQTIRQHIRKY